MFRKLRTVIYHVNDIEKARDWYKKVTGISPYFDENFYVGFAVIEDPFRNYIGLIQENFLKA